MTIISGAIDLSGPFASFAIAAPDSTLLVSASLPLNGRDNVSFVKHMLSMLDRANVKPGDINLWIVGTGPGSFTGLRMAASLVAGLTFSAGEPPRAVGLPSPYPIALELGLREGCRMAILYPSKKKGELIFCGIERQEGGFAITEEPSPLVERLALDRLSAYARIASMGVAAGLDELESILSKPIDRLSEFPVRRMFDPAFTANYTGVEALRYARPATEAKTCVIREMCP